jgi:hypothetical protein
MGKKDRERRPARKLTQGKRFLVVVEGVITEPEYIEAIKRSRQMRSVEVLIETGHTDPIGIVNQAKARRKEVSKTDPYDQVWCVFDAEAKLTQPARFGLQQALDAAQRSGIPCAMSNPCFEIWLLWHQENKSAWIASDAVQSRCQALGITHGKDGKHIKNVDSLVQDYYTDAKNRACNSGQLLILKKDSAPGNQANERKDTERPEDTNPSSGMYKLIDAIYTAFPARI